MKKLIIYKFRANRIGHMALNNDLFLRCLQLKNREKKENVFYICIAGDAANWQLFKMFKREMMKLKMFVIQSQFLYKILSTIVYRSSIFRKSGFYIHTQFKTNAYHKFNNTEKNLHFTEEEEKKGKQILKNIGIGKDDWFVCFHSRDPVYL